MLNEMIIVQTAVSAFNNAALWAPAFLWWGILTLPLFVAVFYMGNAFMQRVGWSAENVLRNVTVWNAGLVFLWGIMFGGNYGVLRNEVSVLPMLTAAIIFLTALFVSSHVRQFPQCLGGWKKWLCVIGILMFVVGSGGGVLYATVLQLVALVLGGVLGHVANGKMRPIGGSLLIILTVVTAVLMQPEYFRFGQLGNLTVLHLIAILAVGMCAVLTFVLFNFVPRGRIYHSAYVKLKWLGRVVCALGVALFCLTEAVPVFLGTLIAFFVLVWLSVLHAKDFQTQILGHKMFAVTMMLFGLILVMPVITCLGILYWLGTKPIDCWSEVKKLL